MMIQKERALLIILLPVLLFSISWLVRSQMGVPSARDILTHLHVTDSKTSYAGKRLLMRWSADACSAMEQLVVHHPPEADVLVRLAPAESLSGRSTRSSQLSGAQRDGRVSRERKPPRSNPAQALSHLAQRRGALPHQLPSDGKALDVLLQNYQAEASESRDEVAGYPTYLVTLEPQAEGRPTLRLWVSREHGVLLRFEELDEMDNQRFLAVFTQVSFQPEEVQRMLAELGPEDRHPPKKPIPLKPVSLTAAQELFGSKLLLPTFLPEGFTLQQVTLVQSQPQTAVHLLYTDGLVRLSLFESKGQASEEVTGKGAASDSIGQIEHIHGIPVQVFELARRSLRVLRWRQAELRLTLISGLSQPEMTRVAEALIRSTP